MKRNPLKIRLTGPQIVKLTRWSCVLEIGMLLVVKCTNGEWIGHGPIPRDAWVMGLVVPGCDVLLGLDILRQTRRFRLARPLLYAGLLLTVFGALVLWTWRG